jgi:prepilin-type N-terminal cleavage/methylation domain-containing protein
VKRTRGFTLLEMLVAATIMGLAIAGLMSGLSASTRNAARLRDYDRVVQLARLRMNDLLADQRLPRNVQLEGQFAPEITGGLNAGWRARVTRAERSPSPSPGDFTLDRIDLEIWWMSGDQRRSFQLEGYRRRSLRPEDMQAEVAQ